MKPMEKAIANAVREGLVEALNNTQISLNLRLGGGFVFLAGPIRAGIGEDGNAWIQIEVAPK